MNREEKLLTRLVQRYRSAPVWNAKRGVGTFVTFEVGDEVSPGAGQLHVWIQYASWSIRLRGHEILSSSYHADDYAKGLAHLEGRRLESVHWRVEGGNAGVTLAFSNELEMQINCDFRNYDIEDDLITFFEDGSRSISLNMASGVYVDDS